jgi:hypothetical protein
LDAAPALDDTDTASAEPSAAPGDGGKHPAIDADLKRKTVAQAFLMLGGIIVGGTLLLLMVVMWGNRTRRLTRQPLPAVAKRDELWYLKSKPSSGGEQPDDPPSKEEKVD